MVPSEDFDRRVQAVDFRHRHVEHDNVGVELFVELDGFRAATGLADHFDVELVFEDAPEALAYQRMVVGEQDADTSGCHATSFRAAAAIAVHAGTRSFTRTPPCSASSSHSSPPISSARSRMLTSPSPRSGRRSTSSAGIPFPRSSISSSSHSPWLDRRTQASVDPGVASDVAERFLRDSIDVDRAAVLDRLHRADDGERRADAGLPLELLDEHLERTLEAEVVQESGVQPLRPRADPIERLLRNRSHVIQLRTPAGSMAQSAAARDPAACRSP